MPTESYGNFGLTGLRPSPTSRAGWLGLAYGLRPATDGDTLVPLWTAVGGGWPLEAKSSDRSLS